MNLFLSRAGTVGCITNRQPGPDVVKLLFYCVVNGQKCAKIDNSLKFSSILIMRWFTLNFS